MTGFDRSRTCLHLVVHFSAEAIEGCRTQFAQGDAVLFLDDGVMWVTGGTGSPFEPDLKDCHFAVADLEARGLLQLARKAGVQTFQDPEFPELLRRHAFCLTWK